jgi:hypothetical protein
MLSHEASNIATKERAEMKMIEFFIARKLSLTALRIQSQSAVSRKARRPGRGSRPRDDASLRPRTLHDDRSTRPM